MKVTIGDIAKMANVSKTTVSRIINNKTEGFSAATKEKIIKLIEESNYKPSMIARGLVTKKTKTIGLIIPDITNPFFPSLVRGAEDCANKMGYHIFLSNSDTSIKKESEYLRAFIDKSVDGVILASNTSSDYKLLKQNNIPCVLLDRHVNSEDYDAGVFLNNIKGAYLAAKLLLEHGHERIVFITGSLSITTSADRLKGYKKAFEEKGKPLHDDLIVEGDYQIRSGYELTAKLIKQQKKFTAIFAANDLMAIGAIKALKAGNFKIPEDVEVIGFDNIEVSQIIEPSLSTVTQPVYEMGARGAKMLINIIEGKKIRKRNIILEPGLVLRESTRNI